MLPWLNNSYLFRRTVSLYAQYGAPVDHPIQFLLRNTKMREDLSDIMVVYCPNPFDSSPTQEIISFSTQLSSDNQNIIVEFQLVEAIPIGVELLNSYYIYHDNPSLNDISSLETYISNPWPIRIDANSGIITYTRPGEHWIYGFSKKREALAVLHFFGTDIQLISVFNSDQGTAAVKLDNESWVDVDLYSLNPITKSAWEAHNLSPTNHILLVKDTGRNRGESNGLGININAINYVTYIKVIDIGEEIYPLSWASSLGGI